MLLSPGNKAQFTPKIHLQRSTSHNLLLRHIWRTKVFTVENRTGRLMMTWTDPTSRSYLGCKTSNQRPGKEPGSLYHGRDNISWSYIYGNGWFREWKKRVRTRTMESEKTTEVTHRRLKTEIWIVSYLSTRLEKETKDTSILRDAFVKSYHHLQNSGPRNVDENHPRLVRPAPRLKIERFTVRNIKKRHLTDYHVISW